MSDQFESDGPYQDAQSAEELERYVMGSTFPKTPAEWWARGEIESLRARIAELEAALNDAADMLDNAYADIGRREYQVSARAARAALNGEKG